MKIIDVKINQSMVAQNFGGIGTARKLVEKTLAV